MNHNQPTHTPSPSPSGPTETAQPARSHTPRTMKELSDSRELLAVKILAYHQRVKTRYGWSSAVDVEVTLVNTEPEPVVFTDTWTAKGIVREFRSKVGATYAGRVRLQEPKRHGGNQYYLFREAKKSPDLNAARKVVKAAGGKLTITKSNFVRR